MKVLQVNAVNGILSTGRNCLEIAEFLNEKGIECYTAYSTGVHTSNSFCISTQAECKYHALMSRITGLQGYWSPLSTRNLLKKIEHINPDIVHLNNLHANYISLTHLLRYLAEHDIATVLTLHDCWFYTGKCTHYTSIACNKWQTGCTGCQKLKDDNKSWFFDRTSKMWNEKKVLFQNIPRLAVIGVSDWITNEAKKSFLSKARIIRRIYNWIDLSIFRQLDRDRIKLKLGFLGYKIILGVSSEWSAQKGLYHFVELAKLLNDNEKIVLIGNCPDIPLPKNILSIPATSNLLELAEYYNAADVFLQLSEEETFGKVVAEALACGIPVISIDSTANGELVDNKCGILLNDNKAENIINAVHIIESYGANHYKLPCRVFAEHHFNMNDRIQDYLDLYKQL